MDLRNDMRQKNTQITLGFHSEPTGEARQARGEASESLPTVRAPESPARTNQLMEEVCEGENLKQALQQVKANKGSPGIDGMTVEELPGYLQQHWLVIREQLLNGTYEPKPVWRVEIEKPDGGGMRKLGIPTVLDRFVQQAAMQVLQRRWDPCLTSRSVTPALAAAAVQCDP
jgi:RNA-directed DNA polymerase